LLFKALDNASYARRQSEAQHRELILLREQINGNNRISRWVMLLSAALISAAIWFQ